MVLSAFVYRAMLPLYPDDLRQVFGEEMAETFAEDLECARRERGVSGVIAVWGRAGFEIVTIAIPGRLASPALTARALSVALHLAVVVAIIAVGAIREAMPRHEWHGVVGLHLRPSAGRR